MLQHPRLAAAPESDKNWLYTVYAAVLLKLLDDLEQTRTSYQAGTIRWFATEPVEVAIVCAIVRLKPEQVYFEVAKRLRGKRIRCWQITFVRWQLRRGETLPAIASTLKMRAVA